MPTAANLLRRPTAAHKAEPASPAEIAAARRAGILARERGIPARRNPWQVRPGSWQRTRDLAASWLSGHRRANPEAAAGASARRAIAAALSMPAPLPWRPLPGPGESWPYRQPGDLGNVPWIALDTAILRPRDLWAAALAPPASLSWRGIGAWRREIARLATRSQDFAGAGWRFAFGNHLRRAPSGGWPLAAWRLGERMAAAHRRRPHSIAV